jgi:hypothetical protein
VEDNDRYGIWINTPNNNLINNSICDNAANMNYEDLYCTDDSGPIFGNGNHVDIIDCAIFGEEQHCSCDENWYPQTQECSDCPPIGDLNGDGEFNILDLVQLSNCILNGALEYCVCESDYSVELADLNGDGEFNILDSVLLASCIHEGNC